MKHETKTRLVVAAAGAVAGFVSAPKIVNGLLKFTNFAQEFITNERNHSWSNSVMSLTTKTNAKLGSLVIAVRASRAARTYEDLVKGNFEGRVIQAGEEAMIVDEMHVSGLGRSTSRAIRVLTSSGPGWMWDGIWSVRDEKLKIPT